MRSGRLTLGLGLAPLAAVTLAAFGGGVGAAPALASSSIVYGWWSEANTGALAAPAPPQVPADGMYAANGPGGPLALSAVSFSVPGGQQARRIVLAVAGGSNVITAPPVACAIAGTTQFKAEQDGAWADRPGYDCTRVEVVGTLDPADTYVTFDATKLAVSGVVSAVVLAGGPADQIAFEKPTASSLVATPAGSATGQPVASGDGTPAAPAGAAAPSAPSPVSTASAGAPALADSAQVDPVGNPAPDLVAADASLPSLPAPDAPSPPAAAASTRTVAPPAGSAGYQQGGAGGTRGTSSTGTRVATALGMAAMLLALVGYAQGRGVLGGRIVPLSARPARRRAQDVGGANVSA